MIIDFYDSDKTTIDYINQFRLEADLKKQLFVNNNEALVWLLCAGVGYGTLAESIAREYISREELIALNQNKAMEKLMALVWYSRPEKRDYFEEIIRAIK